MAITRRSAKAKGSRLQNDIRDRLRLEFPQLEPDDIKSAVSSENGVDIKLSPAAKKLIPYSIEAKNQEKTSIFSWLKQCDDNKLVNTEPVLIFKRSRSKTYCVIDIDLFMKLIKK